MRVFITGCAGFIGTNLILRLLEQGHDVYGADSLVRHGALYNLETIRKKFPEFKDGERFFRADLQDMPILIQRIKPEVVYHFAAQVAVTTSMSSPGYDFEVNAKGSFLIAVAAASVGAPVVYTSTNKVFGDKVNDVPLRELETRWDFDGELAEKGISETFTIDAAHHTPYGVSKLVGDLYVREFGGVANRCSCMYGPHQHGIVDQGWLSHIAQRIIKGEQVIIYGDGKQLRDAVHASDVVRLLQLEGEALVRGDPDIRGQVFNVGGGHQNTLSLLELCKHWGLEKSDLKFEDWRPADQKVFYCDISKAKKVLGWEPKMSLNEGVDELYEWTKERLQLEKWLPEKEPLKKSA